MTKRFDFAEAVRSGALIADAQVAVDAAVAQAQAKGLPRAHLESGDPCVRRVVQRAALSPLKTA